MRRMRHRPPVRQRRFPNTRWPLTPGHEIAGRIVELGGGVDDFVIGDRVAVGWFGGHCNGCGPCRNGTFIHCDNMKEPGWQYPGGAMRIGDGSGQRAGPDSVRTLRRRCGYDVLRRCHDV